MLDNGYQQYLEAEMNMAEIELSLLKRIGIVKRVGNQTELEKQIKDYQNKRNAKQVKVNWQFTTKDARVKSAFLRLCVKNFVRFHQPNFKN